MPVISVTQSGGLNRNAFLDMLASSEGTSSDPVTQDDGYDVLVTGVNGPARFASYATFPNVLVKVNDAGLYSSAAGRYQLLNRWWVAYSSLLKLSDFSPLSQDLIALQQIRESRALPYIDAGNLTQAIALCNHIWASLTGSPYGQHTNSLDTLQAAYILNGGTVS